VAAWEGSSSNAWFRWGALGFAVVAVVVVVAGCPGLGLSLLLVGSALGLMERVEVRVDGDGLEARTRWGFPRVRFPLAEIEQATAIDVRPSRWGGWGYRGSVSLFRRAAWVLHGGPGIRLDLAKGRVFVVAVDDAEAGAAALADLLTRQR
jgi:hypothetical protein